MSAGGCCRYNPNVKGIPLNDIKELTPWELEQISLGRKVSRITVNAYEMKGFKEIPKTHVFPSILGFSVLENKSTALESKRIECTCDLSLLMKEGCQCGAMEMERMSRNTESAEYDTCGVDLAETP